MPAYFLCCLLSACFAFAGFDKAPVKVLGVIDHAVMGCYASRHDTLLVYSRNEEFYASLRSSGDETRQQELSKEQAGTFVRFITECRSKTPTTGLCTREESYKIMTDEGSFSFTDGSCTWEGFSKLVTTLFGK